MNGLQLLLLTERLANVGQVIIRHGQSTPKDSFVQQPCLLRLTTPNLTTGMLIELLVCLDQLGFIVEETDG